MRDAGVDMSAHRHRRWSGGAGGVRRARRARAGTSGRGGGAGAAGAAGAAGSPGGAGRRRRGWRRCRNRRWWSRGGGRPWWRGGWCSGDGRRRGGHGRRRGGAPSGAPRQRGARRCRRRRGGRGWARRRGRRGDGRRHGWPGVLGALQLRGGRAVRRARQHRLPDVVHDDHEQQPMRSAAGARCGSTPRSTRPTSRARRSSRSRRPRTSPARRFRSSYRASPAGPRAGSSWCFWCRATRSCCLSRRRCRDVDDPERAVAQRRGRGDQRGERDLDPVAGGRDVYGRAARRRDRHQVIHMNPRRSIVTSFAALALAACAESEPGIDPGAGAAGNGGSGPGGGAAGYGRRGWWRWHRRRGRVGHGRRWWDWPAPARVGGDGRHGRRQRGSRWRRWHGGRCGGTRRGRGRARRIGRCGRRRRGPRRRGRCRRRNRGPRRRWVARPAAPASAARRCAPQGASCCAKASRCQRSATTRRRDGRDRGTRPSPTIRPRAARTRSS